MAVDIFDGSMYYREVAFCRVYSLESKEKLEKLFLKNRISYFIEWQDKPLLQRIFSRDSNKEKSFFTLRIIANSEKCPGFSLGHTLVQGCLAKSGICCRIVSITGRSV